MYWQANANTPLSVTPLLHAPKVRKTNFPKDLIVKIFILTWIRKENRQIWQEIACLDDGQITYSSNLCPAKNFCYMIFWGEVLAFLSFLPFSFLYALQPLHMFLDIPCVIAARNSQKQQKTSYDSKTLEEVKRLPPPHFQFYKRNGPFTKGRFRPYEGPKTALRRAILWQNRQGGVL